MTIKSTGAILLLISIFGCTKSNEKKESFQVVKEESIPQDIKIPKEIWSSITDKNVRFTDVNLFLKEKNENVLMQPSIKIELRKGGSVDLAKYVTNTTGSFHLKFDLPEQGDKDDLKVFYLSQAKVRTSTQEKVGAGCGHFYEVTTYYKKMMSKDGFLMNTYNQEYISVLAGHFIFVIKKEKETLLTQVSFEDTRYKDLSCEVKQDAK